LIFNSEYATVGPEVGEGNLLGAVADAMWMTGLERNSDIVRLASYAPLLVNVNDTTWTPDAIVFDSSRVYGIPSYWVQVMFSNNPGVTSLKTLVSNNTALACSVTCGDTPCSRVIFKFVNPTSEPVQMNMELLNSSVKLQPSGQLYTLTGASPSEVNSFDNPTRVSPVQSTVQGLANQFSLLVAPYSVNVLVVASTSLDQ